jgi:hypothetical protein
VERIEDDVTYVEQLVVVLKELGAAIAAARLKDDVGNPRSWPTDSHAESWARALLERGFDSSLTSQKLIAWLGQTISGGDRPGGDPVFFALMRGSLSQFAEALREKTRPQGSATPYDPCKSQPRTLGELERWMLANEASRRSLMIPSPVPLNQPPRWPPIPGVEDLTAYCNAHFGTHLSYDAVIRIRGAYCLMRRVSIAEANLAPLPIVADALLSGPKVGEQGPGSHPFVEELRARQQRKESAAATALERQQRLQPLRGSIQRVDDALYNIQGPTKPSEQNCKDTAIEIFEGLKEFRAALDAAGNAGLPATLRSESVRPDERQWLLDALLDEIPAEQIAKVLQLADRSILYKAWQDLAADCWNRHLSEVTNHAIAPVPAIPRATEAVDESAVPTPQASTRGKSICSFSWLHLTDLHFGMSGQEWLWPNMREQFFDDLERLCEKTGPWDLVLFTGDFVQRGGNGEFEALNAELDRLWKKLSDLGSTPILLGVPGNHDLVRPKPEAPAAAALRNGWTDPHLRKNFWEKKDSAYHKLVKRAFKHYLDWKNKAELSSRCQSTPGFLPGDFSTTVERSGCKLGIVGLNTSFLQLAAGDYEGRLALSAKQFHNACGGDGAAWTKAHDVCLLLTHHPPSWLTPDARDEFYAEIAPPGRFAVHLFGHQHQPLARSEAIGGAATRREWQGVSLFGLETWGEEDSRKERLHGYSAGCVELTGQNGLIKQWPRKAVALQAGHLRIVPDHSYTLNLDEATEAEPFQLKLPRPRV